MSFTLTHVVDGGGGNDEAVVADVGHLGDRQDFVLSRGGRDGQSRTTDRGRGRRVMSGLPNRARFSRRRWADMGSPRIELPSPSYLKIQYPVADMRNHMTKTQTFFQSVIMSYALMYLANRHPNQNLGSILCMLHHDRRYKVAKACCFVDTHAKLF